jgi:hypothetical protein
MSTFHFCFERSKVVAHVSTFSYVQTYQESCHNNYFECDYWKLPIKYDLKEKRTSFDSIKLVKVSKGTQYSAESAAPTLVSTCTCRASPAMLSMRPSIKHISHIQGLVTYFLFSNPTHKTETGIANRWETTKSNQTQTGIANRCETTKSNQTQTGIANRCETAKTNQTQTGIANRCETAKTNQTQTGIANRSETTKSKPVLCEFSPEEGEQIKRLWTANKQRNFLEKGESICQIHASPWLNRLWKTIAPS